MIIFDADLEEETIRAAVARSVELVESKGAEPGPIDYWGKRRFAYELAHRWEGYYVVLQAKAEPAAMEELHRVLSLADEVLRHKILRIPEQVYGKLAGSVPERPAPERPAPERQAPERQAEPVAEAVPEPEAETAPEPEAEAAREAEPVTDA
jgi:small subunit ribosomal protein S6